MALHPGSGVPWAGDEGQAVHALVRQTVHKWARGQVPWEKEETLGLGQGDQDPRGHFEALDYAQLPQHLVQ